MGVKEQTRNRIAIAGQLSNAETGQVIHRARVEITKMPDSFKNWLTLRAMQYGANWETMVERPDRTQTAINGHFHFLDLPDGDYTLTASLPSTGTRYSAVEEKVQVSRNGDRIKLAAADIALPPTGIKGQITNAENQPIVMAKVQVKGTKKSTFSDSKGNYLLSGIEVSKVKCTVIFSAQGYQQCSKNIQLFQGKVKPFGVKLSLNKPK